MNFKKTLKIIKKHKTVILPALLFLSSILIFSLSFFIQRHFMSNFDENDHLAIGFLMKNGYLLYKDTFSHHFPLPYYWTYLFTPFWSDSPSRTIAVFRLSIMVLYLLVYSTVYISFKNKISKVAFSVWLILISTFLSLYHGSLVLSESFTAIFLAGVLWLLLPCFLGWEKYTKLNTILLVLFTSATFWTQPLTFFLFVLPFIYTKRDKWKKIFAGLLFLNLVPLIAFFLKGQLIYFWEQGIWFNFSVYQNYFADYTSQGNTLTQTITKFVTNQTALLTSLSNGNEVFQFILSFSFIGIFIYFIKSKNKKETLSLLIIFAATRIRKIKIYTGQPFNFGIFPYLLLSSACFVIILVIFRKKTLLVVVSFILLTAISINNSLKIFKQSLIPEYNYHVFWNHKRGIGEKIKNLTEENEPILIYPHDVDLYYFADRLPPDRFTYWFPWIDSVEAYRLERLTSLESNSPAIIYIGNLDFKDIKDYYQQFFPNLTDGYTNITNGKEKQGIWLRNDLMERINI